MFLMRVMNCIYLGFLTIVTISKFALSFFHSFIEIRCFVDPLRQLSELLLHAFAAVAGVEFLVTMVTSAVVGIIYTVAVSMRSPDIRWNIFCMGKGSINKSYSIKNLAIRKETLMCI